MKKFICAVISILGGIYAWWASYIGSNQIFKSYGLDKIGNGALMFFPFIIGIIIAAMVGCFWYFVAFKHWTD